MLFFIYYFKKIDSFPHLTKLEIEKIEMIN